MKRYLKVNIPQAMREFELAIRKMVITRIIGHYRSIFRGKGLEFDRYVPYTPLDDASKIDWKASARANELLMKEYMEERDIQIFFLVDINSTMVFGSTQKLKNEYAVEMIASLANFILNQGDRIGFALFNDKILKRSMPSSGKRQLHLLIRTLLDPDIYGGKYDLDAVLKFLTATLPREVSLIIIFSDFIGQRNFARTLKILNRKIETIGIMILDPRDRTLPATSQQVVLEDPYSGKTLLVDPALIKNAYEKYAKAREEQVKEMFRQAGADFVKITTDKSFITPLIEFFKKRARKWR